MTASIEPAPLITGREHIPRSGPCVIAANHYQRRGLWIGWPGAVITSVVGAERDADPSVRWLVTGGLRMLQRWDVGPEVPGTGSLMTAVACAYGLVALPLGSPKERRAAVRAWLATAERGDVAGIFPEGVRGRADGLTVPKPAVGTLCRALAARRVPVLPVGVYEAADRLHVAFGAPSILGRQYDEHDLMGAIAVLLPVSLRGPYAPAVAG
jgi:hypothetical protein